MAEEEEPPVEPVEEEEEEAPPPQEEEEPEQKPQKEKKHVTIVLEEDSSKFRPQFYTFRRTDSKNVARGPPFWVLTDHLIAVIWHLFKNPPSEEPIGISQLQWSLEFLRNIRDDTGEYPEYVNAAICGLEDRLLELYAAVPKFLGEEDEEEEEEEKAGGEEGEEGGGEGEEGGEEEGEEDEGGEGEGEDDDEDEEPRSGSIVVTDGMVDRPSESMQRRMSRRSTMQADSARDMMSSPTLKDIMTKAPKKPPKDPELQTLFAQKACSGASIGGKPSYDGQVKTATSGTKIEGARRADMLRFLNSLRKEQTDRISIELKQLEKINEYLKEVESGQCSYSTMQEIKEKKNS